jgi:hypothetical protein
VWSTFLGGIDTLIGGIAKVSRNRGPHWLGATPKFFQKKVAGLVNLSFRLGRQHDAAGVRYHNIPKSQTCQEKTQVHCNTDQLNTGMKECGLAKMEHRLYPTISRPGINIFRSVREFSLAEGGEI